MGPFTPALGGQRREVDENSSAYRFDFQTFAAEQGPKAPVAAYVMLVAAVRDPTSILLSTSAFRRTC